MEEQYDANASTTDGNSQDGFFVSSEPQQEFEGEQSANNPADDRQVEAYRKLQSERDKLRYENERLKEQYSDVEQVKPIADLIYRDPSLLDIIEKRLKGEPLTQGETRQLNNAQVQQAPLPERPVRPERPERYDPDDAVRDPNSESYQYERKMRKFYDDMLAYQDAQVQSMQTERQQESERMKQMEMRRKQLSQFRQEAVTDFGASGTEADAFIQWATSFDDRRPENRRLLYNAWKMNQPGASKVDKAKGRVQELQAESRRLTQQGTVTGQTSGANSTSARPNEFFTSNAGKRRSLI